MTAPLQLLGRHGPDTTVAWTADRETSAGELRAHVRGFATLLPERSDDAREIVVMCRDRYRFAVALLACWERGFAVALPPNPQMATIRAIRTRPGVATVIHDSDGIDKGIDVRTPEVVGAARAPLGSTPFRRPSPFEPDRHVATVYTSGSTGEHTACPKTARQLIGEAHLLAETFPEVSSTRLLSTVPAHHIYGLLFGVLVPMVSGSAFHRRTPLHAGPVAAALHDGAEVLVSVPAHLRGLLIAKEGELPYVPMVVSSAAPLAPRTAAGVQERFGWTVTEVLGSSETGGMGWRRSGGKGAWRPLEGLRITADEEGRMLLDSPFLHPSEDRPFLCADRIEVLDDGSFMHRGRVDGVLKIGGVRVSVAEVERRLRAIDGVHDAAVLAREVGGSRGWEIWAAVVAPTLTAKDLRTGLSSWLASVAMPRRIRMLETLPREANGKITKKSLEDIFARESS